MTILDEMDEIDNSLDTAPSHDNYLFINYLHDIYLWRKCSARNVGLSPVRRACRYWFAVKGIAVEGLRTKIQIGRAQLFGLAEEQISARFEVKMQALEQRVALPAGKMRQHVHAEDAVETPDVDGADQVHGIERDQAAQAWLDQQM